MNYPFWKSHKDPQGVSFFTDESLQDHYLEAIHEGLLIEPDEDSVGQIYKQTTLSRAEVKDTLQWHDDPSARISDLRRDVIAQIGNRDISPRGYVSRVRW